MHFTYILTNCLLKIALNAFYICTDWLSTEDSTKCILHMKSSFPKGPKSTFVIKLDSLSPIHRFIGQAMS